MNETLWKHREKQWKPRNKQAALVVRKANPLLLHTPLPEPPKLAPTLAEKLASESKIRLARIAAIEKEAKERIARRAAERAAKAKPQPPKVWKNMWAAKAAKRMAKSRGLPPPTTEELRKIRAAMPNYGKPVYRTSRLTP